MKMCHRVQGVNLTMTRGESPLSICPLSLMLSAIWIIKILRKYVLLIHTPYGQRSTLTRKPEYTSSHFSGPCRAKGPKMSFLLNIPLSQSFPRIRSLLQDGCAAKKPALQSSYETLQFTILMHHDPPNHRFLEMDWVTAIAPGNERLVHISTSIKPRLHEFTL